MSGAEREKEKRHSRSRAKRVGFGESGRPCDTACEAQIRRMRAQARRGMCRIELRRGVCGLSRRCKRRIWRWTP
eukprot:2142010-Rhodomonas_salina.1